jgi:hypothetical protein
LAPTTIPLVTPAGSTNGSVAVFLVAGLAYTVKMPDLVPILLNALRPTEISPIGADRGLTDHSGLWLERGLLRDGALR